VDNIKRHLKQIGRQCVDWIHLAMKSQEILVKEAQSDISAGSHAPTWSEAQRTLSCMRVQHWDKSSLFLFIVPCIRLLSVFLCLAILSRMRSWIWSSPLTEVRIVGCVGYKLGPWSRCVVTLLRSQNAAETIVSLLAILLRVRTCRVDHSSLSAHHSYLFTQEANWYKTTPYV
jgi:hypothetical protein